MSSYRKNCQHIASKLAIDKISFKYNHTFPTECISHVKCLRDLGV